MTGGGVQVEPGLCRPLARLAVAGLAELARRNGGAPTVPGIAILLRQLELSSSGPALASVDLASQWITSSEAAVILGQSERSARRLAASGRLIARRHGRDWQIDRTSCADYARDTSR